MSVTDNEQFKIYHQLQSDAFRDIHHAVVMYFSNQFEECELFLRSKMTTNSDFAHSYSHALAVVKVVMALFTNEKVSFFYH